MGFQRECLIQQFQFLMGLLVYPLQASLGIFGSTNEKLGNGGRCKQQKLLLQKDQHSTNGAQLCSTTMLLPSAVYALAFLFLRILNTDTTYWGGRESSQLK